MASRRKSARLHSAQQEQQEQQEQQQEYTGESDPSTPSREDDKDGSEDEGTQSQLLDDLNGAVSASASASASTTASSKSAARKFMASTTTATRGAAAPSLRSPFLPTRLETALLAIYPLTLLLGSLFSMVSPGTRHAAYSPATQSHPQDAPPSYFAHKRNIFNVYFVKLGWAWTTAALAAFVATHPLLGPPLRLHRVTRRRVGVLVRYALATAVWAAVTQWFFGPPLIDRGFRLTGGQCELAAHNAATRGGDSGSRSIKGRIREGEALLSATACKIAGGRWTGGQDISGHVFLLILGSALLWFEVLPAVTRAEGLRDGRRLRMTNGSIRTVADAAAAATAAAASSESSGFTSPNGRRTARSDGAENSIQSKHSVSKDSKASRDGSESDATSVGVKAALAVVALMWWMLLMTAAFFHTWPEKFAGLIVAFAALWAIYLLPRGVPGLRRVVGMPGV